jgi:hypothetical protein
MSASTLRASVEVVDDAAARDLQADLDHQVLEDLAVLAAVDRVAVGADHLHVVLREDPAVVAGHGRVQARLPAERGEHGVDRRALLRLADQDLLDGLGRDRLDVGRVGELRVGHDRRGLLLIRTRRYPSSRSARQAWTPE